MKVYILSLYLLPVSLICCFFCRGLLLNIMVSVMLVSLCVINYVKIPYIIGMYKTKRENKDVKWKYVFGISHVSMLYGIICPVLFVALFVISILYNSLTWMHIVSLLLLGIWLYNIWRSVE